MANFKIKYILTLLSLLFITSGALAQTLFNNGRVNSETPLKDYQIAVINQLFLEKKDLMYCPEIGGTPNINVEAVIERSKAVDVGNDQLIFTWSEQTVFFDQLKLYVLLTSDKKLIQSLKLEYYKYQKINIGDLVKPILIDGYSLLGTCK